MSPAPSTKQIKVGPQKRHDNGRYSTKDVRDAVIDSLGSVDLDVFTRRYPTPQDKLDAMMAEVQKKIAGLHDNREWQAWLHTTARIPLMSMNNQLLVLMQRPGATQVLKFANWKKLGRDVRDGERGISVMEAKEEKRPLLDNAGKPMVDERGQPRVERVFAGVGPITVFDVAQTDGPRAPEPRPLSEETPAGLVEDLHAALAAEDEPVSAGLPDAIAVEELAVRLGTITLHRLDPCRPVDATEAESVAYALLVANGMKPTAGLTNVGWEGTDVDTQHIKATGKVIGKAIMETRTRYQWRNAPTA